MTITTKLSPATSDYIRQLYHEHHNEMNFDVESRLFAIYSHSDELEEKIRKLELLVRWHKILVGNKGNRPEQLLELQDQIFAILDQAMVTGTQSFPKTHDDSVTEEETETEFEFNQVEEDQEEETTFMSEMEVDYSTDYSRFADLSEETEDVIEDFIDDHSLEIEPIVEEEEKQFILDPVESPINEFVEMIAEEENTGETGSDEEEKVLSIDHEVVIPGLSFEPSAMANDENETESSTEITEQASKLKIQDLLEAFNDLISSANHYLGGTLVSNYLKSSRPEFKWLEQFVLDKSNPIKYKGALTDRISPVQLVWFKKWMRLFMKNCSQIIPEFPKMVDRAKVKPVLGK